jgi:hypothetical protein
VRRAWLARPDPALAAAEREAVALGAAAHDALLAAGDRLADVSTLLAVRAWPHAPGAWRRFGGEGFARWWDLGTTLADVSREAAIAYFAVAPRELGPGGLETAAAWCAIGHDVARVSRRLGATFFERTAPVLARADGLLRLGAWAVAGLALQDARGWRGAFLAQAWFEAAPTPLLTLGPADYAPWAALGAALAGEVEERAFFAALPAGLEGWSAAERALLLRLTRSLAAGAARQARIVWRELPPALARVPSPEREALLGILARCDASVAVALAEVAPVAGAVLADVPAAFRRADLTRVDTLAARSPAAAIAALRVLPRLHEEATPERVAAWFDAGMAVVEENAHAGRAYFALESRTSVRVLRADSTAATLEETEGLWRKLVQMLSGEGATVRGVEGLTLRPPLELFPAEREVSLPLAVDCLPTHEENCRVYRLLAAQLAARREFGTYARDDLLARLRAAEAPELLEEVFLLAEGVRVQHRLAAAYPGLAGELAWVGGRLLARWAADGRPSRRMVLDGLLALVLGAAGCPAWLPADGVVLVAAALAPLAAPTATVDDALDVARRLTALLSTPAVPLPAAEVPTELLLDDLTGGEPLVPFVTDDGDPPGIGVDAEPPLDGARLELGEETDPRRTSGRPLGPEELRRLLEAGVRIGQGSGDANGPGLPVTDLVGKLPAARLEELRRLLAESPVERRRPGAAAERDERAFFYDEWDHAIGDYRSRWCRLRELALAGDSGEFFGRALADYAALLPEVRRQFQRIRPELYRPVRGLEDGEDFDLNAVTDARVEVRARRAPSTRLYRSRVREARDVATLFLLDMSASTDEALTPGGRRIIDALKEGLVVMTEALDELGDAYAIYGFSGQGRTNVEFYLVKGFAEPLGATVKARIGGIAPRRSTRMGAALRHATRKMATVAARAKHLLLLSDGFPQDDDYGEDRRSHEYGIRDTAVALREADAAGITPFCITVDRAGHDYLREMCDAARYLVLDDVGALPRELPKIYRRVVRA